MEENRNTDLSDINDLYAGIPEYAPAKTWKRFTNYLLDYIFCVVIFTIATAIIFVVLDFIGVNLSWWENLKLEKPVEYLFGITVYLLYYICFEGFFGTTPGKILTRTLLITDEGYRPSFKTIVFRSLWRIVPFEALLFLFDIRLHDKQTGTLVTDKNDYIPPCPIHSNQTE